MIFLSKNFNLVPLTPKKIGKDFNEACSAGVRGSS